MEKENKFFNKNILSEGRGIGVKKIRGERRNIRKKNYAGDKYQ